MHTRNQNKPPITPAFNASRSPSNKSENLDEVQFDKRRKIVVGKMVAPAPHTRSRPPLTAVNVSTNHAGSNGFVPAAAGSSGESSGAAFELNSREDVERGRMEEMRDFIKKLKICINWYMEKEDGYLTEHGNLLGLLESEEKRHSDTEAQMSGRIDELTLLIEEHQRRKAVLQENLSKEQADKLNAMKSYEKEAEARLASENLRSCLSEELERATQEIKRLNDQIKMVQDTNKRLQEYNTSLQQYNSKLQADSTKNADTISKLQKEKSAMMETLTGMKDQINLLKSQLDSSRSSQNEAIKQTEEFKKEVGFLRNELQQVREDRDHQLANVQSLNVELANYKELTGKSCRDMDTVLIKTAALEETCTSQQSQIKSLEHQLAVANEKLKRDDLAAIETVQENEVQRKLIRDLQNHVFDVEYQLVEAEKLRKKLHNTILELKGNIRVFCRVRPTIPDNDSLRVDDTVVSYPASLEHRGRGIELMHNAQRYSFTYDKVFDHEASQEDVFVEISQLVQSALDGYKVCIFAYGQTGSGKTYTMMGRPEAPEQKGLIPRSLEQIFESSQALQSQGWRYKMQASMLEIYNETIRDLLPGNRGISIVDSSPLNKYTIKHDSNGNTHVSDLSVVEVCSINEVSFLLNQAAQSRSVAKTQLNEQSSRSHFVFTLRILGVNEATEQQVQGVLNLIDLAGSERLARSGSTGDRLKETQAINRSLSSLSDVIFAIAKKEDHVPYRNSKLTYLLQILVQPCLGGDSKTLMFVNISPELSSANESICSLRFAARVNACEIGERNAAFQPIVDMIYSFKSCQNLKNCSFELVEGLGLTWVAKGLMAVRSRQYYTGSLPDIKSFGGE
ncbi:Kinesin-5 [Apostasia shenzhenica]|uniref:Kinesin-like protein n=1 Tax=Apostasia shenzhenica TaxID=1088818 RepID=A0A2I0B328_9ASPA|nr:Kinesin-5 [Apostasia shenzhenica]